MTAAASATAAGGGGGYWTHVLCVLCEQFTESGDEATQSER